MARLDEADRVRGIPPGRRGLGRNAIADRRGARGLRNRHRVRARCSHLRVVGNFSVLTICLTVTFAAENLSIVTGFPFGHYHFEVAAALPHIGAVPIIVGLLYFTMGYFSWMIASLLLDYADLHLDRPFNVIALPIIAAFVMVQWDVVMDPPNATVYRAWIWHDGGGYFGVPLSNYFGWYLTVWLFYQAFGLIVHFRPGLIRPRLHVTWLPPILVYLAVALGSAVPYLIGHDGEVVDAAGHGWRTQDLRETTTVVMAFTMLFTSALALLRWAARK
jgi:hypothetical protein